MTDTTENTTPDEPQTQETEVPKTPAQPEPAAAEPVEAQAEGEGEGEAAPADETQAQAEEQEKRRRAGGFQRKLERERRENEMLRAQLAQLQQSLPKPPEAERPPEVKAAEQFDALLDQRLAEREAKREAARQQQEQVAAFQKRTAEVAAAIPDYEEVILAADAPVPPALARALLRSPRGPEIMYLLAKSPSEMDRLGGLSDLEVGMEIVRLEAKASATATPTKGPPKPAPRKPATPAPITPVTARGPSNVKSPDQMTYEEYAAWRASQSKR